MPTYSQTGAVNTDDAVLINGTSDYASKAVAAYRTSDTAGTVTAWVKTTESTTTGTIFSVADTATTTESFFVQIDAAGYLNVGTTIGGTTTQVRGSLKQHTCILIEAQMSFCHGQEDHLPGFRPMISMVTDVS